MRDDDLLDRIANLKRGIDDLKAAQRIGSGGVYAAKIGTGSGGLGGSTGDDFVFRIVVDFGQIALLASLKMKWNQVTPFTYPITMGLGAGWFEYQRYTDYSVAKQKAAFALFGYWYNNEPIGGSNWDMFVDVYATTNGTIESANVYVI